MSQVGMESLVQELQNIRLEMTELKKKIELKEEEEVLMEGDEEDPGNEDWNKTGEDGSVMWDHVLRPTAISPSSPVSINLCNLLGAPHPSTGWRHRIGRFHIKKYPPNTGSMKKQN